MSSLPRITAEIVFLRHEDGGRVQSPLFGLDSRYMPHLVVQDRIVSTAVIDPDGMSREDYLGVAFVDGPTDYRLGEVAECELELMYYPNVSYDEVVPGATFTLREGARTVAHGVVLEQRSGCVSPISLAPTNVLFCIIARRVLATGDNTE
jgi:hypothetical protein